jgi:Leucine-rich repeat (LRR) protein
LNNLEELNISYNQLKSFPEFGNLIKLKRINLENNQLVKIPKSIGKLVNLEELFLNNNKVIEISSDSFRNLNNLELITLTNNQLKKIPESLKKVGLSIFTDENLNAKKQSRIRKSLKRPSIIPKSAKRPSRIPKSSKRQSRIAKSSEFFSPILNHRSQMIPRSLLKNYSAAERFGKW